MQSEGIELPNGEMRKLLEDKKGDKFLSVLQFDCVKSKEMKDNDNKGILQRIRKILKATLRACNTINAMNARAVSIIRYGAGIVEQK